MFTTGFHPSSLSKHRKLCKIVLVPHQLGLLPVFHKVSTGTNIIFNDLLECVKYSTARLFADDCIIILISINPHVL